MTREQWLEKQLTELLLLVQSQIDRRDNPGGQHVGKPHPISGCTYGALRFLEEEMLIALTSPEKTYKDR
jgi:hypothetical protein